MKEKFSTEEWEDLKILPFAVFVVVAGADGKVDQKEVAEFATQVAQGAALKDPLHRELVVDIAGSTGDLLAKATARGRSDFVDSTKAVLKSKLTEDEYQRFIGSLFISGLRVAKASGPWFGDKVSNEEKKMLAGFGASWGLDVGSISKHFG